MEEITQVQKRTEDELMLLRQTVTFRLGGLRAQWGEQTEQVYQQGVRSLLQEIGFTTVRFLENDSEG